MATRTRRPPDQRAAAPALSRSRHRRARGDRLDRARDRSDPGARMPPAPGSAGGRLLREPDPERGRDHARDAQGHGGAPGRGGRADPAGPAARCRGLRLHLGLDGDRRGTGVRADPERAPGDRLHDPDHRRLRGLPGAGCAADRAAHPLSGRHQPLHAGLHRSARLRGPGDGLVQRGGRPACGAHRCRLDPGRSTPARPDRPGSTACSCPAPACAWSMRSPRSRPVSASPRPRATTRSPGIACAGRHRRATGRRFGRLFERGLA